VERELGKVREGKEDDDFRPVQSVSAQVRKVAFGVYSIQGKAQECGNRYFSLARESSCSKGYLDSLQSQLCFSSHSKLMQNVAYTML
jgi:hypothetical protein